MPTLPRLLLVAGGLAALAACSQKSNSARPTVQPAGSTVTSKDLEQSPDQPIEKVLAGRVAGVNVTRTPDGGIAVRIRGGSSIYGNNDPLYVVDGVPIEAGPGGALTGINPYDIESIKVLKDAAETSMYGVRGANGVIVIKTKQAAAARRNP